MASLFIQLIITLLLFLAPAPSRSYPLVAVVDEGQERCFRFNVPVQDDAHVVAVVLPSEDEVPGDLLETWFVEQVHRMAKSKHEHEHKLPEQFLEQPPTDVKERMDTYVHSQRAGKSADVTVKITDQPTEDSPVYAFQHKAVYFQPVVVNHVIQVASTDPASISANNRDNLQGYKVCLHNQDAELAVHVVFDVVLASEDLSQFDQVVPDKKKPTTDFDKHQHLTPLERTIDLSIRAAKSVLREMKYMEQREVRMRLTADSINSRVRWFSYLSVGVLLVVTYLQVTYLKRYFHKKKLM
jgi:hypothetical protein